MSSGLLTIGLPVMAVDLGLDDGLLLWPASVYSLASGCCLLLAGSLADLLGNRQINLIGCFGLSISILACGLARTGIEFIVFRALQGVVFSLCLPTAFSILKECLPPGKQTNIAVGCFGLGQPLGFSVGLVLGGLFEATAPGWRVGYYLTAGLAFILSLVNLVNLPSTLQRAPWSWQRFRAEIDWVGLLLSSGCLGLFSYVCSAITSDTAAIKKPQIIALLALAGALAPMFLFWMNRQEKHGRPALIPNSIWQNKAFTSICLVVLLSWAVLNGMETFLSLFFQEVQDLPPIQAAIRFFPNIIIGIILNFGTGVFVDRLRADHLVIVTSLLSAGSPLLMALIQAHWSWWSCAFWAVLISPLSADVIFTVANLLISDLFTPTTQGLASAVFNTVAQFGTSIGLTVFAILSASVTKQSKYENKASPEALMQGYRAVFWMSFGMMICGCGVSAWGLRKIGKVG
ncbi:hypothetical protein ASPZODRAFT_57848 [Penicilliopsis zonata CBS 506.65]|uniref:Major facilitator superfamily (MFS) profile domain-containing protein n=1 Tax=Penicilliopsis zonata CBS 506.65 TaxID=1073090 RepID=A0A1L9ST51_9EURO|nr:hypothetical protein ASPZODRAFT_57848 [Penicilliopsis zonata CBS 506.65]OJJ50316.1 hypothetical protein ASPZODRAFT_57848 [Penicilliopsis zonata CBS 506.65]